VTLSPTRDIGVVYGAKGLRRDAAANRQRLLDAARDVFARHGLDAGVEEVARVAGVGIGTLYRRFPTKDALIGALVRELLEDVLAHARTARAMPDGQGLEHFLYACGGAAASQSGCLARLWNDPETAALKDDCRTLIAELLRDAQTHGQVRLDATQGDVDLIFWSLRGVIEASKETGEQAWRRHLAITIAGLRPSPVRLAHPALSEQQVEAIRAARELRSARECSDRR
jgi:AcrR family transcriptional regulator